MTTTRKFSTIAKPAALVLGGLLAGSLFSDLLRPAPAFAQEKGEKMSNSLEQGKQMIDKLTSINDRLTRIETAMTSGLKVRVTEMPPVTMKEPTK
jgi:hypothetical protein